MPEPGEIQANRIGLDAYEITDEMRKFLNDLRDSGEINMYGATPYLQKEFGLSFITAKNTLINWINE